ncbi:hypothetical protein MASR1M32_14000 [Rhodobacter sp.]
MTLLEVQNLRVTFDTETGPVEAVRGVSFSLGRERLGIVGESGSGKTMTGRSVLRLIRPPGRIEADRMVFDGQDLLRASERDMRALRGKRIGMVMQDPKYSLNPVMSVGEQLTEGLRRRDRIRGPEARAKAIAALEAVQIRDPERVMSAFPHELSGGMGQRVMIAMMLIPEPDLLIADEPTSALDVTVQAEVLSILDALVRDRGMGLIFISHDLRLVGRFCDRVLVMYKGRIVEELEAKNLTSAQHPYTRGLLNCLPRIGGPRAPCPGWTAAAPGRRRASHEPDRDRQSFGHLPRQGPRGARGRRRQPFGRRTGKLRPCGRKRFGQIHHPAGDLRHGTDHRRQHPHCGPAAGDTPRAGIQPAGADGVPGPLRQPASPPHHRPHPVGAAGDPRHRQF